MKYEIKMEWKKIASMEYGKIVFHYIPEHVLVMTFVFFKSYIAESFGFQRNDLFLFFLD